MATNVSVHWANGLGARRLIVLEGTDGGGGGHLLTKNARRARHLINFLKCPVFGRGFARGGMLAAGIDLHIRW